MDYDSCKGWQVRVPKWVTGKAHTKLFSDSVYGGKMKAKKEAESYFLNILDAHGVEANRISQVKRFNHLEAVGVSLTTDNRRPGEHKWSFCAYWIHKSRQRKRTFTICTHGFSKALEKAVKAREKGSGIAMNDVAIVQTGLLAWLKIH